MTNENSMIDLPRGKLRYTLTNDFLFLKAGEEYINVLKTIHISILDFTPQNFPAKLYTDYYMYNKENNHIYSDKLRIVMLQLNQLGNPEDEKIRQ